MQCQTLRFPDGTTRTVLSQAGEVTCYAQWYQIVSAALLLPLAAVFPILLLFVARQHDSENVNTSFAVISHQLRAAFQPSCWYYEAVLMFRRLLLATFATFVLDSSTSAFLLFATCSVFLLVHMSLLPFASQAVNRAESLMLWLLLLLSAVNVRFDHDQISDKARQAVFPLQAGALAIPLIVFLLALGSALRSCYARRKHESAVPRVNSEMAAWSVEQDDGGHFERLAA